MTCRDLPGIPGNVRLAAVPGGLLGGSQLQEKMCLGRTQAETGQDNRMGIHGYAPNDLVRPVDRYDCIGQTTHWL